MHPCNSGLWQVNQILNFNDKLRKGRSENPFQYLYEFFSYGNGSLGVIGCILFSGNEIHIPIKSYFSLAPEPLGIPAKLNQP